MTTSDSPGGQSKGDGTQKIELGRTSGTLRDTGVEAKLETLQVKRQQKLLNVLN